MPGTLLAIGAHYDDCIFGIPGTLLKAARRDWRVVILALIGDYTNWPPVKGRERELKDGTRAICHDQGVEMRFLNFASHRFEVTQETKAAVAQVVAEVKPTMGFYLWPHDTHRDHEVASTLAKVAFRHGGRVLDQEPAPRGVGRLYQFDNGPRHTIGFEPDTFVDISPVWEDARAWLGRVMALMRNRPFDPSRPDPAVEAKETLARYRGATCGVPKAEAFKALGARPVELF